MRLQLRLIALVHCGLAPLALLGGVDVTDFEITATTVSFVITGTVEPGDNSGTYGKDRLYIGVPNFSGWVNASGTSGFTLTNQGSATLDLDPAAVGVSKNVGGDSIRLETASGADFAVGDVVNASVTLTGDFTPSAFVADDAIVSMGLTGFNTFPDPATAVGTVTPPAPVQPVPEPAGFGWIALGGLLLAVRARPVGRSFGRSTGG